MVMEEKLGNNVQFSVGCVYVTGNILEIGLSIMTA